MRVPRTHCAKGHALTAENVYHRADGSRMCRECRRAYRRANPRKQHRTERAKAYHREYYLKRVVANTASPPSTDGEKLCTQCGETKALTAFRRDRRTVDGRAWQCGACASAQNKAWRERQTEEDREYRRQRQRAHATANRERLRARRREWYRKNPVKMARKCRDDRLKKYGLTRAQYDVLLAGQYGQCAICGGTEGGGHGGPLRVDHCHDSGHIRGLLCNNCNWALGGFGDSPSRLRAAASYLERFRESTSEVA